MERFYFHTREKERIILMVKYVFKDKFYFILNFYYPY